MRPIPRTRQIVSTSTTAVVVAARRAGGWLRDSGPHRWRDGGPAWWQATAARRVRSALAVLAVSAAGALLGVLLLASVRQDVGPFQADFSVTPSLHGGTEVLLPPLGSLTLDSHAGPAHLKINLAALDEGRTRELVTQPNAINRASADAVTDVIQGLRRLTLQVAGAAVLGAVIIALLVFRSMRRAAVAGGVALALVAGSLGVAALSFQRSALAEPTYRGLLSNAQTVVGDADRIYDRYGEYTAQLQKMVTNVSRLYATISNLPVYEPADGTIRVLHISDMHLNPAGWSVVRTVVEQFHIGVVVDTGDITDWGSEPEASFVSAIGELGVPYVYIRGNHDSATTAAAVARQRNAIVLDNRTATVAGLTFAGIGDPRFTPDKSAEEPTDSPNDTYERAGLQASGVQLAQTVLGSATPVNVALVHDPAAAGPLTGQVPLVLAGHRHHREISSAAGPVGAPYPQTTVMVEGSTGGAGLRGLDNGEPLPLELSVLYFDGEKNLQAYDEISVGGAGLTEVQLQRHLAGTPVTPESTVTPTD